MKTFRPNPRTLAGLCSEALEHVAELHPDHWPAWLLAARDAVQTGEPMRDGYTNTLRLALVRVPRPGRFAPPPRELVELRHALLGDVETAGAQLELEARQLGWRHFVFELSMTELNKITAGTDYYETEKP